MRKMIVFILCLILSMSSCYYAFADEYQETGLTVDEVNESFLNDLKALGVNYNEKTIISETIVYPNTTDKEMKRNEHISLKIINENEAFREQTVLFFQNEKGELMDVDLKMIQTGNTKGSSAGSYTNYAVIISCTASYEINTTGGYWRYRPMSVSFSYQVKSGYSASNVGDVTVSYRCGGVLEENPGFSVINSAYTHVISVYKANPSLGIVYYQSSPLASNRVIDIGIGLFAEHDVQVSGYYGSYYFSGTASNFS